MHTNKKITKATFKSFVKKNKNKLFIKCRGSFDGMTDCIEFRKSDFAPIKEASSYFENTLGIQGVWLVGQSRNFFKSYNKDGFIGIDVSNCCSYFTVAIKE